MPLEFHWRSTSPPEIVQSKLVGESNTGVELGLIVLDKKAFNLKTLLISLPKLVLPMIVYAIGHYTLGWQYGYLFVALTGILGFAFKNRVFKAIEAIYKKEKYATLEAYKQKK